MPLVLDTPEQITVTTVRISSFSVTVEPLACVVSYQTGFDTSEGFVATGSSTASFSADQISTVDPQGAVYSAMKDALYELLETRVGSGTIS